ncbi:MAG: amino acid racemase [Treponemataceae bacterium]|nr:amino acid racemase [Treponemataceae bacterium]
MKKLGLIGGTGTTSTLLYYKGIMSIVQKKTGKFPNLNIESLSVLDILQFSNEKNLNQMAEYILNSFRTLKEAGCDFAALTGILPHIVLQKIEPLSPIKIVSIIDTTLEYAKKSGISSVGLIGTIPTMQEGFFKESFEESKIKVITPKKDEMLVIERIIEEELEFGLVKKESQETILTIIKRMMTEDKIQSVILGSTELPILLKKQKLDIPLINSMKIHAEKLAEMICI